MPVIRFWNFGGGATLDSALRFTNDDPFERLDKFYQVLGKDGPVIRSLCRGQNLFGYSPYADNVVVEFMKEAVRSGNRRVRIFDALNDWRNIMVAIMGTKTYNGHAEAALSYTTSPIHDVNHFVNFCRHALDLGADSLAIKDMAGLLHPVTAYELIEAMHKEFPGVPITLHSHCTNGLAIASYVVGMIKGIDYLDTAYGPMAGSTSQPPIELLALFARELGIKMDLDLSHTPEIDAELRAIRKELVKVDASPDKFGNPWPSEPDATLRQRITQVVKLLQKRDRESIDRAIAIIEDQIMVDQATLPLIANSSMPKCPAGCSPICTIS